MAKISQWDVMDHFDELGREHHDGPRSCKGKKSQANKLSSRDKQVLGHVKAILNATSKGHEKEADRILVSIEDAEMHAEVNTMVQERLRADREAAEATTRMIQTQGGLRRKWNVSVNGISVEHGLPQMETLVPSTKGGDASASEAALDL